MPLYDQYAPYRKPMSLAEQNLLEETIRLGTVPAPSAIETEDINEVFGMQGLQQNIWPNIMPNLPQHLQAYVNHASTDAYLRIARDRTAFDLQSIDMPTEPKLDQRFPGIDPEGKHCHVDMGFAQRITRLTNAAALCDGETKELLDDFLNGYNPGLNQLTADVKLTCRQIQLTEHMAKECPHRFVSAMLENAANNMAQNPTIQKMDRIITAMEQVAGLRGGVLDPQAIQDYNGLNPGVEMNGNLPTGFRVARRAPETFAINFQNFDNIARQNYYANPQNWGFIYDHKIPKDPTDSLALAASMRRYVGGTTSDALDGLFSAMEQSSTMSTLGANRATLVIVDGKTVSERIQEEYNKLGEKPKFSEWYAQNAKRMSAEIVAAGLMAGKRVEAYVPGPDGKLPDQPTVLHKTGYEPTPDKPVTLNAWERFFNKLGFYKGKAAKAKEHQALLDARERMKANYKVAQNERMSPAGSMVKEMFFGDYLRQHNIPTLEDLNKKTAPGSAYLFDRSHATSACICMMAAMGHDIRKILDPNQLQEEKKAAAETYIAHAMANRTLVRLTDKKPLAGPERQRLTNELMDTIDQHAENEIEHSRPKMSDKLSKLSEEQRQALAAWGIDQMPLSSTQQKVLAQLTERAKNAATTPMTEEQKTELALLSEHQQKWELRQELQDWQQKTVAHEQQAQQIRHSAQQDKASLMNLLNEANRTPNFELNLTDPRIPNSIRQDDPQWLGSVIFHGHRALEKQVNNIMAHTDLKDPAQRDSMLPILNCAATVMFDGSQTYSDRGIEVIHGYLRAAQQTVVNHYPAQNGSITPAETENIANATNALAEKTMDTANRIGFFFRSLSHADTARVVLAAPVPDTERADNSVNDLLMEQVMMNAVSVSTAPAFTDKLLPYMSAATTQAYLPSEPVCQSMAARFGRENNNWASDAKLLISGEVEKSIALNLDDKLTVTHSNPCGVLRTTVDANQQVQTYAVKETVASPVQCSLPKVLMTQAMGQKLGIRVPQDRQIAPQASRATSR